MGMINRCISFSLGILLIFSGVIILICSPDESISITIPIDADASDIQFSDSEINEMNPSEVMSSYFIENKGQIADMDRKFYSSSGDMHFLSDGILMRFRELDPIYNDQEEHIFDGMEDKIPDSFRDRGVVLKYAFINANHVSPVGSERCTWNTNYFKGTDPDQWYSDVPNYMEVVYPGIWDGIDIVYRLKDGAVKYDVILAPGADPSLIKFRIEGGRDIELDRTGNLVIGTDYRDILDTKPTAFYNSESEKMIDVDFRLISENIFGFDIGDYDHGRSIVIDPLTYSTYLGGNNADYGYDIEVDSDGNAFVAGYTYDDISSFTNFPTTSGAYDTTNDGSSDVFVTKLNSDGSSLIYSTFLGGSGRDVCNDLQIDTNGNAYVTGYTANDTVDYPTTSGAFNTTHNGREDIFVTKLNSEGSSLVYSTYLGTFGWDEGRAIEVDSNGNAIIVGWTSWYDYPTTVGAFDTSADSGYEVVVTKLNSEGSSLVYSTYLGGNSNDRGMDIAIDTSGNAYIVGITNSNDFPTTNGAYDTTHNGESDMFVTKLNTIGSSLLYSTYIGGTYDDEAQDIVLDSENNAYLTGYTLSRDYPSTPGAYDNTFYEYFMDIFVTKLNPEGSSLVYSAFIGTDRDDYAYDIELDSKNSAYITGYVEFTGYPTTMGAYDTSHNGYADVFITKFSADGSSLIYSTFIGGSSKDTGYDLDIDKGDNVYVTGSTGNDFPTTSGSFDPNFNGQYEVFVTKFPKFPEFIPPSFGVDSTPTTGTTGDPFTFNINIRDNVEVNDTYVEYWFGTGTPIRSNMDVSFGKYTHSIIIPSDSTEDLHYVFYANDLDGNWNQTIEKSVIISDNDAPVFGEDSSDTSGSTGELFDFIVSLSDNLEVAKVNVEFWYGAGSYTTYEMSGSGTYTLAIDVPIGSIEMLHYIFHAFDDADNWAKTDQMDVDIIDNDLPSLVEDTTDPYGTTGDHYEFQLDISDNIGIDEAWVEYWFGMGDHINSSMNGEGPFDLSISIPADSLLDLNYIFHFNDTSGNWDQTLVRNVSILDNDLPMFSVDDNVQLEDDYHATISINAFDNVDLERVRIDYWFDNIDVHKEGNMLFDGVKYSIEVDLPIYATEAYYTIEAVDTSGNNNSTSQKAFLIPDTTDPEVEHIENITIYLGSELEIEVNATDNIGIESLIWEGDPRVVYGSGFIRKPTESGFFQVILTAIDLSGNEASIVFMITILPLDHDTDGDGIPDLFENENGLDMNLSSDASLDPDSDGLTNLEEYLNGTMMNDDDSDDDGMPDGWEVINGLDALISSADNDADGDGKTDLEEFIEGSDPNEIESIGGNGEGFPIWIVIVIILVLLILFIGGGIGAFLIFKKKDDPPLSQKSVDTTQEDIIPGMDNPNYNIQEIPAQATVSESAGSEFENGPRT